MNSKLESVPFFSRIQYTTSLFRCLGLAGLVLVLVLPITFCYAQQKPEITVPIQSINEILDPLHNKTPAYAVSKPVCSLDIAMTSLNNDSQITCQFAVESYTSRLTFIPLLPHDAQIQEFKINDVQHGLSVSGDRQGWVSRKQGLYNISVTLKITAHDTSDKIEFTIPTPGKEGGTYNIRTPGNITQLSISPLTSLVRDSQKGFIAVIPRTDYFYIRLDKIGTTSWSAGHLSLAGVVHKANDNQFSSEWQSTITVDLLQDGLVEIPLLPDSVAVNKVLIDDNTASLTIKDGHIVALINGTGRHIIKVYYNVVASYVDGVPTLVMPLTDAATRSISLTLSGKQEVNITPAGGIKYNQNDNNTTIEASIPRAKEVKISWREALPDEDKDTPATITATTYHFFSVEEGVLIGNATARLEIRQGGLDKIEFDIPKDIEIDRVTSKIANVVDWRVTKGDQDRAIITIYLDRRLDDVAQISLRYEKPFSSNQSTDLPLVKINATARQRGATGLLSTRDTGLRVSEEDKLLRVGSNYFPSDLTDNLPGKLTFGFKYSDSTPIVNVSQTAPAKVDGKFNSTLENIISITDVGLNGSIEGVLDIKAGRIANLQLSTTNSARILSVAAPLLREHRIVTKDDTQDIYLEFTQEVEGTLRFNIKYESLFNAHGHQTPLPLIKIIGADVDRGKIILESRSVNEIITSKEINLTPEDPNQLPIEVIARSNHPILRAYSYVWQPAKEPQLTLEFKKHIKEELPPARIISANYNSQLATTGSITTTAHLVIQNIREQFLRIRLPESAKFLSATVNGVSETPVKWKEDPTTFLLKLAGQQDNFEIGFSYADRNTSFGILTLPTIKLPNLSLHSDHESWQIAIPTGNKSHKLYYVKSDFDTYYHDSNLGLINLDRSFTLESTNRAVTLMALSSGLDEIIKIAGLLILPLLYFTWVIYKESSLIFKIIVTTTILILALINVVIYHIPFIWNILLTIVLWLQRHFYTIINAVNDVWRNKRKDSIKSNINEENKSDNDIE
jgi:hypothetical protein